MSNLIKANNTFVFSPEYYLQKYLENQHIKQDKFAQALDTSNQKLNKILNGDLPLDNETINKIATTLGTSKELWQNLNKEFQNAKLH